MLDDGSPRLEAALPAMVGRGRFENGTIVLGFPFEPGRLSIDNLHGNGADFVEKLPQFDIPVRVDQAGLPTLEGKVREFVGLGEFVLELPPGVLSEAYVGGQLVVANVSRRIVRVQAAFNTVATELFGLPYELRDDDTTGLPKDPDFSLTADLFGDAYIFPVFDGGGLLSNIRRDLRFKLNVPAAPALVLRMAFEVEGALQSEGARSDSFWIAYLLEAFQPHPDPARDAMARADNDPDAEETLSAGSDDLPSTGSAVFLETLLDQDREFGFVGTEGRAVPHEIGHQFGLDERPAGFGIMSPDVFIPKTRFHPEDLNLLRLRVASPGVRR